MKKNSKTKKRPMGNKRDLILSIYYIVTIIIIGLAGLFSNSYFAYDVFNSSIITIITFSLLVLMLIIRAIQIYFKQKTGYGKLFSILNYGVLAIALVLQFVVDNRIYSLILLGCFLFSVVLLLILASKYIKDPTKYTFSSIDIVISMISPLLLLVLASRQNFLSGEGMWIPIVIFGIILSIFAVAVFFVKFRNIEYFKASKGNYAISIILLVAFSFLLAGVTTATINYGFDSNPETLNVEIIDKNVSSGARQMTSFTFKILINDKAASLDVPVDIYHSKEIGDYIEIKLYAGFLGYSYYVFEYM